MPLVCAGTPEARHALLTEIGLADRFKAIGPPRWTNTVAFRRLLASSAAVLPPRRTSELDDEKVRAAILTSVASAASGQELRSLAFVQRPLAGQAAAPGVLARLRDARLHLVGAEEVSARCWAAAAKTRPRPS